MSLLQSSASFIEFLEKWQANLPAITLREAARDPQKAAIVSVDVINGFCYEGALASPRVAGIVKPVTRLMEAAWAYGLRHIALPQDTHEPEAVEFGAWAPHAVRGTAESETVPEIKALPFYDQMAVMPKNSIQSALNTELGAWIKARPEVDTFLVLGDCTDLCTYQLAMHLRLEANAAQLERRVIVPVDCVDTYDMPLEAAAQLGIMPHPGDLIHAFFLYHMALNGIEVYKSIK
jgi:nicotinamidase-related amidase